jgi:hypothetical protein
LRYSASYRRRERLTPFSANRSWSFAPLCRDCLGLRRSLPRLASALSRCRSSCRRSLARALVPVRPSLVLGLAIVRRRPFLRFLPLQRSNDPGLVARRFLRRRAQSCAASLRTFAGFFQRPGFACSRLEAACSACALWRCVLHAAEQRCAPTSVTCQVFSTLAPFLGFAPAESVLAVSRTPFGLPFPSFCCQARLSFELTLPSPSPFAPDADLRVPFGSGPIRTLALRRPKAAVPARDARKRPVPKQRRYAAAGFALLADVAVSRWPASLLVRVSAGAREMSLSCRLLKSKRRWLCSL